MPPKCTSRSPHKRRKTSHTTNSTEVPVPDLAVGAQRDNAKRMAERTALDFVELPLDILLEIFKYLHPLDLLNLSYTTKELRSILTASYSTSVWKKVYKTNIRPNFFGNIEYPPDCPPGVDIRHYTSVLFGDTCLFCARPKALIVHWSALTRLCEECGPIHLLPSFPWVPTYESCWSRGRAGITFRAPRDLFKSGNHSGYILKENFESQTRALEQCVDDAARAAYKEARLSAMKQNFESFQVLESWGDAQMRQKYPSIADRSAWFSTMLAKEGYGTPFHNVSVLRLYRLEDFPRAVRHLVSLSDEAWDGIKAEVLPIFELQQQKSRENTMIGTFKQRISDISDILKSSLKNHPKPWIHPPLSTIAKSEHFSCIVRPITGNDQQAVIRSHLATSAVPHMPDILTTWRAEADEFLIGLLDATDAPAGHVDSENVDRAPLELATTFFKCQFCSDPISYPRILMHQCLRRRRKVSSPDGDADEREPLREVHGVPTITEESIWNRMSWWLGPTWNEARQFISVDETATKSAKAIVRACGEDPNVLISNDMNERNFRLECRRCSPAKGSKSKTSGSRRVMTWKLAILHDLSAHPDNISSRGWSLVTSESVLAQVEERETNRRSATKTHQRCRHCGVIVQSAITAADHLSRKHSIVAPAESMQEHLYVLLDIPMKAHGSVVKI